MPARTHGNPAIATCLCSQIEGERSLRCEQASRAFPLMPRKNYFYALSRRIVAWDGGLSAGGFMRLSYSRITKTSRSRAAAWAQWLPAVNWTQAEPGTWGALHQVTSFSATATIS